MKIVVRIIHDVVLALILLACFVGITYMKGMEAQFEYKDSAIDEMDRAELHYDADDYFMMVDKENSLIGFYDGAMPINHTWVVDFNGISGIPEGVYDAYIQSRTIVLVDTEDKHWATTIPIAEETEIWAEGNYENGYPALVY